MEEGYLHMCICGTYTFIFMYISNRSRQNLAFLDLDTNMNFCDSHEDNEMDAILDSLIECHLQFHAIPSSARVCSDPVRRLYKPFSPPPPKSFVKRRGMNPPIHSISAWEEAANLCAAAFSVSAPAGLERFNARPH